MYNKGKQKLVGNDRNARSDYEEDMLQLVGKARDKSILKF